MKSRILAVGAAVLLSAGVLAGCRNTTYGGTVDQGSDIGQERAKEIAFADAGVAEADTQRLKVSRETDDGIMKYDVDFTAGQKEYSYDIAAADGAIISYDIETKENAAVSDQSSGSTDSGSSGQAQTDVKISAEEAKKAALARVQGATEQEIRMELEFDDGYYIYEGDIIHDRIEYEFEIDAQTGNFLKWEEERY